MNLDLQRWTLFASVLILSTGYLAVFRPLESAIAGRYAAIDDARATIEQRAIVERDDVRTQTETARRETEQAHLQLRRSRAALADRFLQNLAAVGERDAVVVRSLLAGAPQAATLPRAATAPALLDDLALDVTMRGRYGDVIRAVRDLDSTDVAARIALAELRPVSHQPRTSPDLDATLHVTLLREADETHPKSRP